MMAVSSPIPTGFSMACLVIGAVFGRIYGEIVSSLFPMHNQGGFAIVGAASVVAGVTRSISIILIVLEMTLQMEY